MYATNFWLIAIGTISFALTIQVNGVEVVIPTFVGWCLVAWGCWGLRERNKAFWTISLISIALAILTFPDLFRYAIQAERGPDSGLAIYDLVTGYPVWILGMLVTLSILVFIAFEADRQARSGISVFAIAVVLYLLAVELLFFFEPFTFTQSYLPYFFAAFSYLAMASGLTIWAAKNIC